MKFGRNVVKEDITQKKTLPKWGQKVLNKFKKLILSLLNMDIYKKEKRIIHSTLEKENSEFKPIRRIKNWPCVTSCSCGGVSTNTHKVIYILSSTDKSVLFYQYCFVLSVRRDRLNSRIWDRNPVDSTANPRYYRSATRKPAPVK